MEGKNLYLSQAVANTCEKCDVHDAHAEGSECDGEFVETEVTAIQYGSTVEPLIDKKALAGMREAAEEQTKDRGDGLEERKSGLLIPKDVRRVR